MPSEFHREWAAHQNLAKAYHELQEKFDALQKEKEISDGRIQDLERQIKVFLQSNAIFVTPSAALPCHTPSA